MSRTLGQMAPPLAAACIDAAGQIVAARVAAAKGAPHPTDEQSAASVANLACEIADAVAAAINRDKSGPKVAGKA